jgi:hypothetical protein
MVGTMGVALTVGTIPGQSASDRLGPGKMELGLGIHGEPGAVVADLRPVDSVVSLILKQILSPVCPLTKDVLLLFMPRQGTLKNLLWRGSTGFYLQFSLCLTAISDCNDTSSRFCFGGAVVACSRLLHFLL